jgi:uncharacterized protein (DUF486 family)
VYAARRSNLPPISAWDKENCVLTIVLLLISNIFMTFAWYGHLRYQNVPLWKVAFS